RGLFHASFAPTVTQLGLFSQQYPPPLLPKPGKDNLRLQKLLKRSAKRKASVQASQSATPFRSSLSPVNEASPDLEYCDHSTPPKTPETLPSYYNIQPAPRFTVRPLYQHVASPYPQQAAYGRATRLSPQTVVPPSFPYSQLFTTVPTVASTPRPSSFTSEGIVTVTEPKKQTFGTNPESHSGLRPVTAVATPPCIPKSPGPALHSIPSGQAVILPLTVLTSIMKCRSPRPTFKAAEHSKSPKPMFDVPQIRMYTASTSYYETSRTPPSLLIVMKKPKGLKSKMNGWSRLKKHMVVEQEEPKFPEVNTPKETRGQDQGEEIKLEGDKPNAQEETQTKDTPKVTKMWDAVLFQMFSTKENIIKDEPKEIPSFAYKLPVLLFSPRFDAKKLKEAASRPVTKISTVFEMGLIGRKGKEEEPKDFNRTARGFTTP
uniref:Proline rich 33 n=1 Tax=Nothobranchius furzeri TaxID=105023 RepID=A0A8C6LZP9_NOTFU